MKKSVSYLVFTLVFVISFGMVAHAALVNVSMQNLAFNPPAIIINAGDTVEWTNNEPLGFYGGLTYHTTTSGADCTPDGIWDSGQMMNSATFEETFDIPGVYPYHCTNHCLSNNMVGTVTVNASSTIPVPSAAHVFGVPTIASPVLSTNAALVESLGVGSVATGGGTLSLQVALDQFEGPVDVYFLLFVPFLDPNNIYQLTSSGTFQTLSLGFAPLNPNVTGPISESILGNIPTSSLPHGQYFFAVLVTPPGDHSLTKFYVWIVSLTL